VYELVAVSTKRDQIGLVVVAKRTAPLDVVNVEILRASTCLAAPTIALQDFLSQPRI
jgi:hypothetical protein